jgi:hypothetical protein
MSKFEAGQLHTSYSQAMGVPYTPSMAPPIGVELQAVGVSLCSAGCLLSAGIFRANIKRRFDKLSSENKFSAGFQGKIWGQIGRIAFVTLCIGIVAQVIAFCPVFSDVIIAAQTQKIAVVSFVGSFVLFCVSLADWNKRAELFFQKGSQLKTLYPNWRFSVSLGCLHIF